MAKLHAAGKSTGIDTCDVRLPNTSAFVDRNSSQGSADLHVATGARAP
jgi:hypothetical protein